MEDSEELKTAEDRGVSQKHEIIQSRRASRVSLANVLTVQCLLAAFIMASMVGCVAVTTSYSNNATRDFVEYWAAGKQLIEGHDPYDVGSSWQLERSAGSKFPVVMMNPPFILWLVAPLGLFNSATATKLWLMLQLTVLGVSVWILWHLFGKGMGLLIFLLGFCFAPTLVCILNGQIGVFLLFGVTLFLALHGTRPFLSGVVLMPCAMKPHLFLPFGLVLLLWTIRRRSYRVIGGLLVSLVLAAAVAYWFDPDAWAEWAEYIRMSNPADTPIWNLSRIFRLALGAEAWVQFVPAVGACVWGCWYFSQQQDRWNWLDQGLLLLLVSVVFAPYSWFPDEAILLPCLIASVHRAEDSGRTLLPLAAAMAASLFELGFGSWSQVPGLVWSAPTWLAWYLYARRRKQRHSVAVELHA